VKEKGNPQKDKTRARQVPSRAFRCEGSVNQPPLEDDIGAAAVEDDIGAAAVEDDIGAAAVEDDIGAEDMAGAVAAGAGAVEDAAGVELLSLLLPQAARPTTSADATTIRVSFMFFSEPWFANGWPIY